MATPADQRANVAKIAALVGGKSGKEGDGMTGVEIKAALDGAPEFVADAVERLALSLGETHPTVVAGRRIMASLVVFGLIIRNGKEHSMRGETCPGWGQVPGDLPRV